MHMAELQLGDIDIDTSNRHALLQDLHHVCAVINRQGEMVKHNTGVYFHMVPVNPLSRCCSVTYTQAEHMGCYKIDVLNNSIYDGVKDENHLQQLMRTPPMWELLQHAEVVSQLAHINNHYDLVAKLKPKNVTELACVLALIRPGKRYLVRKCEQSGFGAIQPEVWHQDSNGYTFKKSHAISLSWTIVIQLNLLIEGLTV
jgi:hypothetical protein